MTEGGTVALCDLVFESDLSIISSASVGSNMIFTSLAVTLQVSCRTLYDSVGGPGSIGETSYSWTFYAEIGELVEVIIFMLSKCP